MAQALQRRSTILIAILVAALGACGFQSEGFDAATARAFLEAQGLPVSAEALVRAVIGGEHEQVEALLAAGVDPDGKEAAHPLLFAIDVLTAERLLRAGASVDARDAHGGTALMGAVTLGDEAMVELLIDHGADVNATDAAGRPALLYATVGRFLEIENRLLAAGAEPLPGPEIALAGHSSFLGRYGREDGIQFEIVADPGRLLIVEQARDGQLYAYELAPLSATRFYRTNDPGAAIFEIRLEDGRVTALARMQSTTWEVFPRVEKNAG